MIRISILQRLKAIKALPVTLRKAEHQGLAMLLMENKEAHELHLLNLLLNLSLYAR